MVLFLMGTPGEGLDAAQVSPMEGILAPSSDVDEQGAPGAHTHGTPGIHTVGHTVIC